MVLRLCVVVLVVVRQLELAFGSVGSVSEGPHHLAGGPAKLLELAVAVQLGPFLARHASCFGVEDLLEFEY